MLVDLLVLFGFGCYFTIFFGLAKAIPERRKRIILAAVPLAFCSICALVLSLRALSRGHADPFAETDAKVQKALKQAEEARKAFKDLGLDVPEPANVEFENEYPPLVNGKLQGVARIYRVVNGQRLLQSEVPYVNGKEEGIVKSYTYAGGATLIFSTETPYVSGNRDGVEKGYYQSGGAAVLVRERPYVNGKVDGLERRYSMSTGKLTDEVPYVSGRMEGECRQYDENTGSLVASTRFAADKQHGTTRWYFPSGRLRTEEIWEAGEERRATWWDEQGGVTAQGTYRVGLRWEGTFQRPEVDFGSKEVPIQVLGWTIITFKAGQEEGKCTTWDASGNLLADGAYKKGKMWDGTFYVEEEEAGSKDKWVRVTKRFQNGREVK